MKLDTKESNLKLKIFIRREPEIYFKYSINYSLKYKIYELSNKNHYKNINYQNFAYFMMGYDKGFNCNKK